ncbi:hypothetical protein [Rhodococcus jostii]|uniref:hypothetical protein n=1 Tax=Rhodococcus jostii TaxID=132919 RepID=UPI003642A1E3
MKTVHTVLARVGDQLTRRPLDVLHHEFDGIVGFASDRKLLETPMHLGNVPMMIVSSQCHRRYSSAPSCRD